MSTQKIHRSLVALAGVATLVAAFASATTLAEPPASTKPAATAPDKGTKLTEKEAAKQAEKVKKQSQHEGEKAAEKAGDKSKAKESIVQGKAEIGKAAPTFTLTDTDGKTVTLASVLADKKDIVVLEWFNPDCPFVKKHHSKFDTFKQLYKNYSGKGVKFFAINSGGEGKQGAGLERNKKARTDFSMEYPVLLDQTGAVGKAYGAKTTPHMFVIAKDGTLAYAGAIDNDSSVDTAGSTNHVAKALDELLAGGSVTTKETTAYGCSVKYN